MVTVFSLARQLVHLHIDGHSHLNSVNPRPPSVERRLRTLGLGGGILLVVRRLHLVVQVLTNLGQFLVTTHLTVAYQVSLSAALVVSIAGVHPVAWRPLVEVGPLVGIIYVTLVLVNLVQGHQSLVIYSTGPQA